MVEKSIYFLSGLPRTGSTLLASILGQNPKIHATATSPLCPLLVRAGLALGQLHSQYTFDAFKVGDRIFPAMVKAYFDNIDKPIIFDKHRMWPRNIKEIMDYINPNPRIVCTVRPIAEVITSYLVLADQDPDNFIDAELKKQGKEITNEARAGLLWMDDYVKGPYDVLVDALAKYPDNILLVDYRDLVFTGQKTLKRIYDFSGIFPYAHDWKAIENKMEENDNAWGMKNLHKIRPELKMSSAPPEAYLPADAIAYFSQFDLKAWT